MGSPACSSTRITVLSTALTLAGTGRGSRGLAKAFRSSSSWSAPSRESSTPARGFERAPFSSIRCDQHNVVAAQEHLLQPGRLRGKTLLLFSRIGSHQGGRNGSLPGRNRIVTNSSATRRAFLGACAAQKRIDYPLGELLVEPLASEKKAVVGWPSEEIACDLHVRIRT